MKKWYVSDINTKHTTANFLAAYVLSFKSEKEAIDHILYQLDLDEMSKQINQYEYHISEYDEAKYKKE